MPGITTSMMTRSGLLSLACSTPFSPSSAKATSNPCLPRISPRIWRSVAESSTTNTLLMAIFLFLLPLCVHDDCLYQAFFIEWFDQILIGTDHLSAGAVEQRVLAGQHNHGGAFELLVLLDQRAGLVSIQARHHDIHKDDVGLVIYHLGQAVKAVFGKNDLATRLREEYLSAAPDGVAVVDQQHFYPCQWLFVVVHLDPSCSGPDAPMMCVFNGFAAAMLTYLPTPVMAFFPSDGLPSPESRRKQNQHGEYLQPPGQHRKRAYPGLEVGQHAKIAGRPDHPQSRPCIVDTGNDRGERGDKIQPADQQHKGQRGHAHEIQEDESQHREHEIGRASCRERV